jgi:hypothetical protein
VVRVPAAGGSWADEVERRTSADRPVDDAGARGRGNPPGDRAGGVRQRSRWCGPREFLMAGADATFTNAVLTLDHGGTKIVPGYSEMKAL